jgi:hypothetical protein
MAQEAKIQKLQVELQSKQAEREAEIQRVWECIELVGLRKPQDPKLVKHMMFILEHKTEVCRSKLEGGVFFW